MKRSFQVAVLLCAFAAPCFALINMPLDAPQDNTMARRQLQSNPELQPLRDEYANLIRTRIMSLNPATLEAIFGPAISTNGSISGGDTNRPAAPSGPYHPQHPADLVLPIFAPGAASLPGGRNPDPAKNHDHSVLHAIGDLGYVEIYYGIDGGHFVQAALYHRADKGFVPYTSSDDLNKRLEWDTNRFAAVKTWLDTHLPKVTDLGVIQVPEVSPLPEKPLQPGEGHRFVYAKTVQVWVQGGGMAFNIAGKEQPLPEAKMTGHVLQVSLAAASPDAPQPGDPPVFVKIVSPDEPVAFTVNDRLFIITPKFINLGVNPGDNFKPPAPIAR